MIERYCDRCGQFCGRKYGEYVTREPGSYSLCYLELCNECQKELDRWINNKEVKLNNSKNNRKNFLSSIQKIFK